MTPVPDAHTHARTIFGEKDPRGGGEPLQVYPNWQGKTRGDENRGALRVGVVEENFDTIEKSLAGHVAAVTHEEHGAVRIYVWRSVSWVGPFWALSEEIIPMEGLER